MADAKTKSWAVQVGGRISAWTSDLFAHPYTQIGVIVFCVSWFAVGLPTDLLTAALSILAITLTQMVLNRQNDREAEDRRRDIAMHAKLDELLLAMQGARDEMAGIEDLDEEDIQELKELAAADVVATSSAANKGEAAGIAKMAVDTATKKVIKRAKSAKNKRTTAKRNGGRRHPGRPGRPQS